MSTDNTKTVILLCLACVEEERIDGTVNNATCTFMEVPMCDRCYHHWKSQKDYLSYYEWAGWEIALEKLQKLAWIMYGKKE